MDLTSSPGPEGPGFPAQCGMSRTRSPATLMDAIRAGGREYAASLRARAIAPLRPARRVQPPARRTRPDQAARLRLDLPQSGIEPKHVAEWAGHSVDVLLRIYTRCLDGGDHEARKRNLGAYLGRMLTDARCQPPSLTTTSGQTKRLPAMLYLVRRRFRWWWQVVDSNHRRRSRRFYRPRSATPCPARIDHGRRVCARIWRARVC